MGIDLKEEKGMSLDVGDPVRLEKSSQQGLEIENRNLREEIRQLTAEINSIKQVSDSVQRDLREANQKAENQSEIIRTQQELINKSNAENIRLLRIISKAFNKLIDLD